MNKKYMFILVGVLALAGILFIATKNPPVSTPNPFAKWETYISNELGIEFQYPLGFFYQKPTTLALDCKTAALPNKCPVIKNGDMVSQNEAKIGGQIYCAQIETGAAAGSFYGTSRFNRQTEKGCFALELIIRSTNCGVYGTPEDAKYQACEKENAAKPTIFKNILNTFKDTSAKTDFGFIRKIENKDGKYFADFDNSVFLTGVAAEDAAIRAKLCTEDNRSECIPNDYFIENPDRATMSLEFAEKPEIQMETFETGTPGDQKEIISLEKFAELINDPTLNWHQLPYHLIIENNQIVKISEQYIP